MSVKEEIVEKIRACGYGMFEACELADKTIREFLASGKKEGSFGIMGSLGKCLDVVKLQRK